MPLLKKSLFGFLIFFLSSFPFGKLVKICENASALQSYLLINNTEENTMLIKYLT